MSSHNAIDYWPSPTCKAFIKDYRPGELFYDWIVGPVGCVAPETLVLTEAGPIPIVDIDRPMRVLSWNARSCRFQRSWCGGSFLKGKDYLYRVTTRQGEFDAAGHHLLLCADGKYRRVSDLREGQSVRVCSSDPLLTTAEFSRRVCHEDARRWRETIADLTRSYADAAHQRDLQLLQEEDSDQSFAPAHSGAHTSVSSPDWCADEHVGGLRERSRERSHPNRYDLPRPGAAPSLRRGRSYRCINRRTWRGLNPTCCAISTDVRTPSDNEIIWES